MPNGPINILVVDDDPSLLAVLEASLAVNADYNVSVCLNAGDAAALIDAQAYDLVVTDYSLNHPQYNGLDILRRAKQRAQTLVIIITAFASLEITLESIKLGAFDFLTKPFQLDELQLVVRNGAERVRLTRENHILRERTVELLAAVSSLEKEQRDWVMKLGQLASEETPAGGLGTAMQPNMVNAAVADLNPVARRRQMQDQISSYMRMGETLSERMLRERVKIESLIKNGLLPEDAFQRGLREPSDLEQSAV